MSRPFGRAVDPFDQPLLHGDVQLHSLARQIQRNGGDDSPLGIASKFGVGLLLGVRANARQLFVILDHSRDMEGKRLLPLADDLLEALTAGHAAGKSGKLIPKLPFCS